MSELLKINVNDHVEKKNGLSYLSWAWAWAEVLKIDPQATWEPVIFMHDQYTALPYMSLQDGSAMVKVNVTIKEHVKSCLLPVMNHRNQAIKSPDAFAVNTAIMRCLTKAISMHGLGLYIYAGEDLPVDDESPSFRGKNPLDKISSASVRPKQTASYPLWIKAEEEPVSVHSDHASWVDAFIGLMDRVEQSKKIASAREKMTKMREVKEANQLTVNDLPIDLGQKLNEDYQHRIRRLGAQTHGGN